MKEDKLVVFPEKICSSIVFPKNQSAFGMPDSFTERNQKMNVIELWKFVKFGHWNIKTPPICLFTQRKRTEMGAYHIVETIPRFSFNGAASGSLHLTQYGKGHNCTLENWNRYIWGLLWHGKCSTVLMYRSCQLGKITKMQIRHSGIPQIHLGAMIQLRFQIFISSWGRHMVAEWRLFPWDLYSIGLVLVQMSAPFVLFHLFHSTDTSHSIAIMLTGAQLL